MFFKPFRTLYHIDKQVYKLEQLKKLKIHNIFYILLLEQNITRLGQIDKKKIKLEVNNSKKYKIKPFKITQSIQKSQNQFIYQGSIFSFFEKITWKKKILRS